MASSDGELEEQLLQAGNKLVDPPSSVDELLSLLDVKALIDRKSTRLNSSHRNTSRMPSSA